MSEHLLLRHGAHDLGDVPLDFDGLATWLLAHPYEGIVWWDRTDGRLAKLKRRDFPHAMAGGVYRVPGWAETGTFDTVATQPRAATVDGQQLRVVARRRLGVRLIPP